jgi:ribonuclease R
VLSILGHKDSRGMAERIVLHENGIIKEFAPHILVEAEKLHAQTLTPGRVDLRNECIVTIDGADAKDLDDAISVKKFSNGHFELGVHIADVAEYVREGSALDREAYKRGTSIYTPDEVIPMLPEHLSNNLCSLHPGSSKATLSIMMELDMNGKVLRSRIEETLIESKQRFTYDEVQEIINELDGNPRKEVSSNHDIFKKYPAEIIELLRNGLELKRILDKRRAREGKIDFDLKEVKIITDVAGKVVSISKRDRSESHKVIEEFMILANEEISRFFSEKKIPFLYRVHERPSEEKTGDLIQLLDHYGYHISHETLSPRTLREIMDTLHEKEYYFVLSKQILQSMSKAIYSEEMLGHFGLALTYYSHFTSPIRRYPDLQIHRIIKAWLHKKLDKKELVRYATLLPKVAKQTSTTERRAESIEYLIRDIKIIDYMQDKIGQIFDGIIASIGDHGIYVELPNGIEGLVYMRDMRATHHFDEWAGTLKSLFGGKTFRLGDPIRVRVTQADKTLRRLDFEVVK